MSRRLLTRPQTDIIAWHTSIACHNTLLEVGTLNALSIHQQCNRGKHQGATNHNRANWDSRIRESSIVHDGRKQKRPKQYTVEQLAQLRLELERSFFLKANV